MPRRRTARRSKRRLARRQRRFTRRKGYSIKTPKVGLPDRYFVTLKYSQTLQLQVTGGGGFGYAQFRGNSVHSPFVGVGDNAPVDAFHFREIYRYCKVVASTFRYQAVNYNGDTIQLILFPSTGDPLLVNPDVAAAQRYSRQSRFTGNITGPNAPANVMISSTMRTSKIFGIPSLKYDVNQDFSNDFSPSEANPPRGTVPNKEWLWRLIAARPHTSATGSLNVLGRVDIWYKCVFYGRYPRDVFSEIEDPGGDTGPNLDELPIDNPGLSVDIDFTD